MICANCGHKNDENFAFCVNCGNELNNNYCTNENCTRNNGIHENQVPCEPSHCYCPICGAPTTFFKKGIIKTDL